MTADSEDSIAEARGRLMLMIQGYRASAMIQAAATLGVADAIGQNAKQASDVAREAGAHPDSLKRLLRGLAVLGLAEEVEPGRFRLTEVGEGLRSDAPDSLRRVAMTNATEQSMRVWSNLLHSVKTGETTFDHVMGKTSFDWFAENPEISKGFNLAMSEHTKIVAPTILAVYDFSKFEKIVDLGGGNGTLLAAILKANPGVRGVNLDSAAGAEDAPRYLEKAGVADRCEIVHRDFFESVPEGGNAYIMKSIIHDWNDELATKLLKNCRKVIPGDGKLLVFEPILPATVDRSEAARLVVMSDLNMLVNTGGRERTEDEFRSLLAGAGFAMTAAIPTHNQWAYHVIEAVPG